MQRGKAFVAIEAAIVADLYKERSVAELSAAHHASGAAQTTFFVDRDLIVRVFNRPSPDGINRAAAVLSRRDVAGSLVAQQSEAKAAIAAEGEGVNAFNRRRRQDALTRAVAALRATLGIDLPDGLPLRRMAADQPRRACKQRRASKPRAVPQEPPPGSLFVVTFTSQEL